MFSKSQFKYFHRFASRNLRHVGNFFPSVTEFLPSTPKEISTFIHFLKNNKSSDCNGVGNKVLKILPPKHVIAICYIINAILRLNYFPTVWKEATVLFVMTICLPKKSEPLSYLSSYRPISLLSLISKIAETVFLSRLNDHLYKYKIIPDFQYGFRYKHGTEHQLLRISEFITDNLNKRWPTAMLLFDAQQAFDRVWHDDLFYKLIELKFLIFPIILLDSKWVTLFLIFSQFQPASLRVQKCLHASLTFIATIFWNPMTSMTSYDYVVLLHSARNRKTCTTVLIDYGNILLYWYSK